MPVSVYLVPDRLKGHVFGPRRRPGGENGWVHRTCRKCGTEFQWPVKREWDRALGSGSAMRGYTVPGREFRIYLSEVDVPSCNEVIVDLVHRH